MVGELQEMERGWGGAEFFGGWGRGGGIFFQRAGAGKLFFGGAGRGKGDHFLTGRGASRAPITIPGLGRGWEIHWLVVSKNFGTWVLGLGFQS